MLGIEVIDTVELGDRSYVVHDGSEAIVIDPQRDIDRVVERLSAMELRLALVCETHVHNDYLTGGLALSRSFGVPYVVSEAEPTGFEPTALGDAATTTVGGMSLRAIATPGHTPDHVTYLVESAGEDTALFTGGSLLYGAVGRTDLVGTDPKDLARAQHRSVQRLARNLPADTPIFPTHGFGSFCAARSPAGSPDRGTIADERLRNPALLETDETAFAETLVRGFTPYPTYYDHMAAWNRKGVEAPDLSPAAGVGADRLHRRLAANDWVIDLRPRRTYAEDHLAGTVSFEVGPPFGTYLGWIVPFGAPLTLLADDAAQVAAAQRQLVRIGWDRPLGVAVGRPAELAPGAPRRSYPVVTFSDLPAELSANGGVILDVRRPDERASGQVRDAVHVPLHRLLDADTELPAGRLWVHCASGFRASIAASLLERLGRDVVLIDDDMGHAADLHLLAS
jgi:glyoxylase-like metal-dependent hydrolase (beta-lactamase superfamily II)/rhodanese-related sulfurtransferase